MTSPSAPPLPPRRRQPSRTRTPRTPDHLDRRHSRAPWWSWALPILGLGLAIAIPFLILYAYYAIIESTDGDLQVAVTDPAAPGYETLVTTTPSHLLLSTGADGALSMVAVMALASNDVGGTVLLLPPETLTEQGRLVDLFGSGEADAVRAAVARMIQADVDAHSVVDDASWSTFTEAVAPLAVNLTDNLVSLAEDGSATVVFPAGDRALTAAQVGQVVSWVNPDESLFNRVTRQREVWRSWIETVRVIGDAAVPGETESGIGRMIRGLANGVMIIEEAPVASTATDGLPSFVVNSEGLASIVARMLPFPLPSEPGARARVRLLDGAGGVNVAADFSAPLVAAGAQIVIVGNASTFGLETSSIIYHDAAFEPRAQAFAAALGGATLTFEPITDTVLDVTVIIGDDLRRS